MSLTSPPPQSTAGNRIILSFSIMPIESSSAWNPKYPTCPVLPVVASVHTNFVSYLRYYRLGFLEEALWSYLRFFYGRCDQVWVPTESIAELFTEHGIREGIQLWPRGVDTSLFSPERRSMEWRRGLGIEDDELVEVTPESIRLRKRLLDENDRKKESKKSK